MKGTGYTPKEQLTPEELQNLTPVTISEETCNRVRIAYVLNAVYMGEPAEPEAVRSGANIVCRNVYTLMGQRIMGNLTCRVK